MSVVEMLWTPQQQWSYLGVLVLGSTAVAVSALVAALCLAIWRKGLLALVSSEVPGVLRRPLFDVLHDITIAAKQRIINVTRFSMLLFFTLDEEEQKSIRSGLGPELQEVLFRRPIAQLLPSPVRRFLFGPQDAACAAGLTHQLTPRDTPRDARERCWAEPPRLGDRNCADPRPVGPSAGPRDDLKAAELEAVLAEWTVGAVSTYVKLLGIGTCRQLQTVLRRRIAPGTSAAPKWSLQALSAAPTLLGGSMISLGCGTLGMAGGGFVGAICGLVPALLTFGLSIPVGAMIGGLVGWFCGLVSGILLTVSVHGKTGGFGTAHCRQMVAAKCCVD
ncbi:unnamed protein product [Symbiodinium sp. CCMP2456]|nr:unnamed protein product [Symbiodinium sp. CCMP2456]